MGIVNVTPDSFSDGGRFKSSNDAVGHARQLIADGADILDIGGESTRPGAAPVSTADELERVIPVIEGIRQYSDIPLSVDTMKAAVAEAALERGADIINDVSALTADAAMPGVAARFDAGVVLMHMRGTPGTMQRGPVYDNVLAEVHAYLKKRLEDLAKQGLDVARLAIDPGIGFGKTVGHNVSLIANLEHLLELGRPVLVGVSRKNFIGALLERTIEERLAGSLGALSICVQKGAGIMRVHDVRASRDFLSITKRLQGGND
jgi:dihydropteroate synthase